MDDRTREHARTLVGWSARVERGDDVVVSVGEGAHDLAVAVCAELGDRGATVVTTYDSDELHRAYLRAHDGDFDGSDAELALYEHADVVLRLGAPHNTTAMADVPGKTQTAYSRAHAAAREARLDSRWVSTVHPTRALAQQAGMSFEAYRDFVYDAVLRDWASLAEEMAQLKEVFDAGSEVRLVTERDSAPDTDLTMSIEGRVAVNSAASVAYDSHNLPSGEVFTAPFDTEGEVFFDVPMTVRGRRIRDVWLAFESGEVVDFSADTNEEVLADVLDTDDGARRLGELGVGMNRGVDRFTDNILFDEKMGETVHLALGRAYRSNFREGEEDQANESAVHVDLITDVSERSRLEVDGDVVQRNGRFRWEPEFEASSTA